MNWVQEAFAPLPVKPKGWVTINDIVKETGNKRKTVAARLSTMVENGELETIICLENGKRVSCYRKKITNEKRNRNNNKNSKPVKRTGHPGKKN